MALVVSLVSCCASCLASHESHVPDHPYFPGVPTLAVHLALAVYLSLTSGFVLTFALFGLKSFFTLPNLWEAMLGLPSLPFLQLMTGGTAQRGHPPGQVVEGVLALFLWLSSNGDGCCLATVWSNQHWHCLSKSLTDANTCTSWGAGVKGVTGWTGMLAATLFWVAWFSTSLSLVCGHSSSVLILQSHTGAMGEGGMVCLLYLHSFHQVLCHLRTFCIKVHNKIIGLVVVLLLLGLWSSSLYQAINAQPPEATWMPSACSGTAG